MMLDDHDTAEIAHQIRFARGSLVDLKRIFDNLMSVSIDNNDLNPLRASTLVQDAMRALDVATGIIEGGQQSTIGQIQEAKEVSFLGPVASRQKICVIKVIREFTGLGLKESKLLSEQSGRVVVGTFSDENAQRLMTDLRAFGAEGVQDKIVG